MRALPDLLGLIEREIGTAGLADVLATAVHAAAGASDEAETSSTDSLLTECLWDAFAAHEPAAFYGPPLRQTSALGFAYLYARKREPDGVVPLALSASENAATAQARRLVRRWSGLPAWRRPFRHVVFNEKSVALVATASLLERGYGSAFTFHPRLRRTALYADKRIAEYRRCEYPEAALASVILHEETHLATALCISRCSGPAGDLGIQAFECAASIIQYVTYLLLRDDRQPTARDVSGYLEEHDEQTLRLVGLLRRNASAAELVGMASRLAVASLVSDVATVAVLQAVSARPRSTRALGRLLAS